MKSTSILGKELNKRFEMEIRAYLNDEKFLDEKTYTVFSDGCIADERGNECAYELVPSEDELYGVNGTEMS